MRWNGDILDAQTLGNKKTKEEKADGHPSEIIAPSAGWQMSRMQVPGKETGEQRTEGQNDDGRYWGGERSKEGEGGHEIETVQIALGSKDWKRTSPPGDRGGVNVPNQKSGVWEAAMGLENGKGKRPK